jgi:hypothetical protein
MLIYLVVLLSSIWLLETRALTGAVKYSIALAPAVPLVFAIVWVAQVMYGREDEFQRSLWIEGMLWGTALTLAATTIWGFLEKAGAVHIPLFWVFPFFTGATLIAVVFLARKYK